MTMENSNFDFGGFIDDDNLHEEEDCGFEEYLTVHALLCLKYGDKRGNSIYQLLAKFAKRAAAEAGGGDPGLLFTDDGGEFVSFHDNARTTEQE
jgi:hypothetical protein